MAMAMAMEAPFPLSLSTQSSLTSPPFSLSLPTRKISLHSPFSVSFPTLSHSGRRIPPLQAGRPLFPLSETPKRNAKMVLKQPVMKPALVRAKSVSSWKVLEIRITEILSPSHVLPRVLAGAAGVSLLFVLAYLLCQKKKKDDEVALKDEEREEKEIE